MNADKEPRGPLDDGWDALAQAWQQIAPPRLEHAHRLRTPAPGAAASDLRFRLLAAARGTSSTSALIVLLVIWYLREGKGTASFLWGFMMMWFVAWGLDFAVQHPPGRMAGGRFATTAAWLDLLAERCAAQAALRAGLVADAWSSPWYAGDGR